MHTLSASFQRARTHLFVVCAMTALYSSPPLAGRDCARQCQYGSTRLNTNTQPADAIFDTNAIVHITNLLTFHSGRLLINSMFNMCIHNGANNKNKTW
jgi:hypothetical protein